MASLPEDFRNSFTQTVHDRQNVAKYVLRAGLDTTDSIARSLGFSVVNQQQHAWLMTTGFSWDIRAFLMDMPFD